MISSSLDALVGGLLTLLIFGAGLAALLLLCSALLPNVVERAEHNVRSMPVRSFLVGLINFAFFAVVAAALLSRQSTQAVALLGLAVGTALLGLVAVGMAAIARLAGERLRPNDTRPVRQLLWGAITLELATLVPIVGWFAVPTLAGLTGLGAVIIALIWRRPQAVGPQPEQKLVEEARLSKPLPVVNEGTPSAGPNS